MIKLLGDWASDTYKRYVDVSMDKRYDSMKLSVEAFNKVWDQKLRGLATINKNHR